jgi:hypothetical protein
VTGSDVDFFWRLRYGQPPMSDDLFYEPAVLKVIRAILVSGGIRSEPDLEDAIGEVVLACIEHVRETGRPPKDVPEAIAIARPIARGDGLDAARKRARRGKSHHGLTAEADEHARERQPSIDPVDEARMLSAIRQVLKDDQIEALADVGAGVPKAELAAESRASQAATRKRVQRSRSGPSLSPRYRMTRSTSSRRPCERSGGSTFRARSCVHAVRRTHFARRTCTRPSEMAWKRETKARQYRRHASRRARALQVPPSVLLSVEIELKRLQHL